MDTLEISPKEVETLIKDFHECTKDLIRPLKGYPTDTKAKIVNLLAVHLGVYLEINPSDWVKYANEIVYSQPEVNDKGELHGKNHS